MADDIAPITEIQVTDAPASVDLQLYRGPEGPRGAYIIPGSGNPANYFDVTTQTYNFPDPTGAEEELVAQLFDWYLDLKTTSDTYLSTFQLKKENVWEQIFKVIPNVYNTNRILTFTSGAISTNVVVSKNTLLLSQKFGDQTQTSNFDVFRIPGSSDTTYTVASQSAMLALSSATVGHYAYRSDKSQFFRLKSLPYSVIDNWQPELSINADIDIENLAPGVPYPVMSSFVLSKPTYNGTNYTFPISIVGSQLHPVNGLEAISGSRNAHISISVI